MQVKSINSLARGLQVLAHLQAKGGADLADLHRQTGIPKASLLRILKTLMQSGLIWQRMVDGVWVASFSLADLAGRISHEARLLEIASPILADLTAQIEWPSVLAVPRLTHMEVIETNAARAYFDDIALGPYGFQINMLRSASGRAFIAFCEDPLREVILDRLRKSGRAGDANARDAAYVGQVLTQTRSAGFGLRDPDFGGDFDKVRGQVDDGRQSLAVPIRLGAHVPGTLNITWTRRAMRESAAIARFAPLAMRAAAEIGLRMQQNGSSVSSGETTADHA